MRILRLLTVRLVALADKLYVRVKRSRSALLVDTLLIYGIQELLQAALLLVPEESMVLP